MFLSTMKEGYIFTDRMPIMAATRINDAAYNFSVPKVLNMNHSNIKSTS